MKQRYPNLPGQAFRRPGPSVTRVGATIVLVIALLAGLGYGSQVLLYRLWDRVVEYQSPYTQPLVSPAVSAPALASSVVLFVVDGLRLDTSRQLANLSQLRQSAVNLIAETEQPSLSLPGGAALGTGAPPYVHGVTTNWYEGPIAVDSLFAAVKRAGLPTAHIGWDGWIQLYGDHIDTQLIDGTAKDGIYDDTAVRDLAATHFAAGVPAGLTVVYFSSTDDAGHSYGGASAEYLAAAQEVDGFIAELLAQLDLTTTTVIITSDHGHIDTGGHGGPEEVVVRVPLVMTGSGIVAPAPGTEASATGTWPLVRQIDIAPTIAALLGTEVPAHSLGLHLTAWLAGDTAWQAQRMLDAARTRLGISSLLTGIGTGVVPAAITDAEADLAAGRAQDALTTASEYMGAEQVERGKVEGGVLAKRQAERFWPAIGLALVPLLLLLLLAKPPRLWGSLLAAVLFFVAFSLIYHYAHGLTYSFSAFNSEDQVKAFITLRLVEGAGLMLITGLIGALITRDLEFGLQTSAGLGALWTGAMVFYGLSLHVTWFYYSQGLVFPDYLPNFVGGFKTIVYLITMTGAGFAAVGATLLAIATSGFLPYRRQARTQWRYR